MYKTLIIVALATVMVTVACGGGEPRMTVEEYATACKELAGYADLVPEYFAGEAEEAFERNVSEVKEWNPPAELQARHEVVVRYAELALRVFQDLGVFDLMRDFGRAMEEGDQERMSELQGELSKLEDTIEEWEDEVEELQDEIERITANLSPATQALLQDADCF